MENVNQKWAHCEKDVIKKTVPPKRNRFASYTLLDYSASMTVWLYQISTPAVPPIFR